MRELTRYDYFESAPPNPYYENLSKDFKPEIDFAFFAAKFGWSKKDYQSITPVERLFILKQVETETVQWQTVVQASVELAVSNVHRKRGKKHLKLFKLRHKHVEAPISDAEAESVRQALNAITRKNKT